MFNLAPASSPSTPALSPATDPRFQRLPVEERTRISTLLKLFAGFDTAKRRGAAIREAAAHFGGRYGFSEERLRKLHTAWVNAGRDWTSMINGNKVKDASLKQPEEFCQFVCATVENNRRKAAPAFRKIHAMWHAGERIPGYGTWKEWYAREHPGHPLPVRCPRVPSGWTMRNLSEIVRKRLSKAARALASQGFAAATPLMPTVIRNTRELGAMHLVTLDDFRLDFRVFVAERMTLDGILYLPGIYDCVGVAALDVGSRRIDRIALKPRAKGTDEDGDTTAVAITRADTASLIGLMVAENGLPTDKPMTLLIENASASLTAEHKEALEMHFTGRVQVRHTGLFRDALAAHGWYEGGGKPWSKGWIESFFSLLWNELAATKGYQGASYDRKPGALAHQLKEANALIKAAMRLDERLLHRLRFEFVTMEEAHMFVQRAVDILNARTWHNIADLDVVHEFRIGDMDTPRPLDDLRKLPVAAQKAATILKRRESPDERWHKLCAKQPREAVPPELIAPLMSEPREVRPDRGAIRFQKDGVKQVFFDGEADPELFMDGAKWLAHWSPLHAPESVFLFHPETKAFVAAVARFDAVNPLDVESCHRAAAHTKRAFNRLVGDHRERHAGDSERIAADRNHNAMVMMRAGIRNRLTGEEHAGETGGSYDETPAPMTSRKRRPPADRRVLDDGPAPMPEPAAPAKPRREL